MYSIPGIFDLHEKQRDHYWDGVFSKACAREMLADAELKGWFTFRFNVGRGEVPE